MILWIILLIPITVLAVMWSKMPERVPLHWNLYGEIDRWGDRSTLIYFNLGFPLFTYVLLLLIPRFDPKKKIRLMGPKFDQLRMIIQLICTGVLIMVTYASASAELVSTRLLFMVLGLSLLLLGNFLKTVKPNFFIGIRTPWTLLNDQVWEQTHRFGGYLWFGGGLLLIFLNLIALNPFLTWVSSLVVLSVMVVIPIIYSFILYRKTKTG